MKDQQLNLHFKAGNGDAVTIRQGDALPLKHPEKINISGNIKSVGAFLAARYGEREGDRLQKVNKNTTVVIVNDEDRTITLQLDPNDCFGTVVTGKLEVTEELKQFQINTARQFNREELVKLIRFNRRYFTNNYDQVLKAYQQLNLSASSNLSAISDIRGNKESNFKKQVDSSGIPTEFSLLIPVFKGFNDKLFRVEICLEATDASVRFWFESVELHELMIREQELIFEEQLELCKDFAVIYK
jgi:activator of HSP90 ATPase